jgi:RimJ/RimL family protein N-acetyltransferase
MEADGAAEDEACEGYSLRCAAIRDTDDGRPIWWDEYLYAMLADEWPGNGSLSIREIG